MYSVVKTNQNVKIGDVVSFNPTSQSFEIASTHSTLIGVANSDADTIEGQEGFYASVVFAGVCFAKASREIAREGGLLEVENGKVYIDNTQSGCGIISPTPYNQATKQADDLVLIHLR